MIPLKKTLYSLMLNEDVVREVDRMAHRMGTNRSNLVNQILAEYVGLSTPEQRIREVLGTLSELLTPSQELVPAFDPNAPTMSLKSSLEYKYRPTVKYEVELSRAAGPTLGTLSVLFRTQSASLIDAMTRFFRLWTRVETAWLTPQLGTPISYALYDGRFERPILTPRTACTSEDVAKALCAYIQTFDTLLKGNLAGRLSEEDVEREYVLFLQQNKLLL